MNCRITLLALALLAPQFLLGAAPRERISFNRDWRFEKLPPGTTGDLGRARPGFDDRTWRTLNLPHDWAIEGPFGIELPGSTGKLPFAAVGWYRKTFDIPADDQDRRIFLDLDGAMSHAQVWLNGERVGEWAYGYTSFRIDLTPQLRFGAQNTLAVRLDNPPASSRWYPGGGIYRNVWLVKTAPVHLANWGVFITTPEVSREQAVIEIRTTIENQGEQETVVRIEQEVFEQHVPGRIISRNEQRGVAVAPGASAGTIVRLNVSTPSLWEPGAPRLHVVRTTVWAGDKPLDLVETPFGIRRVVIDPQRGLELNGRPLRLNGVCLHSDAGPLGTAISQRAMERQLELLRELGCNAVRTAHNPPAPEFLELCDRMGFLVITEAFDAWRFPARDWVPNDYARDFVAWHERDIRAFVRRDRNHPSIIMWSSGNEIQDQRKPDGVETARRLRELIHAEDPTRLVTGGLDDPNVVKNGFHRGFDVIGFNYKPRLYAETRKLAPEWPVYGSETASTVSSRGEYFFPVEPKLGDGAEIFQVSSYDLYCPPWATTPDAEFASQDDNPSVLGEFVWTGIDYLGEPTPYDPTRYISYNPDPEDRRRLGAALELHNGHAPARSSYFGILDLCGFKKDRFYLYQARWRPELPMAHLLPHWTWPERNGEVTPVHVYTSGDAAELFLNGRSLGRRTRGPREYRLQWDNVVYSPGELKVVAYKNGREWAGDLQRTAGGPAKLRLAADRTRLRNDGLDLAFVTVSIHDSRGVLAPRASNRVQFRLEGPGEIVAVDNGDPTRLESFHAKHCSAFNGLCLVIVRTTEGATGPVTLHAEADGLQSAKVTLHVAP